MTSKRLKFLLTHLRDNLEKYMQQISRPCGICECIGEMCEELKLNHEVKYYISDYLFGLYPPFENHIVKKYGQYRWTPGQKKPRINFLNSVIEKL